MYGFEVPDSDSHYNLQSCGFVIYLFIYFFNPNLFTPSKIVPYGTMRILASLEYNSTFLWLKIAFWHECYLSNESLRLSSFQWSFGCIHRSIMMGQRWEIMIWCKMSKWGRID